MLAWGEIMLVFLIALLLFGADKIPDFARTAGKMMGEYRKVRDSLRDELENVKDELEEVKEDISNLEDYSELNDDEDYRHLEDDIEDNIEEISDDTYRSAQDD